MRRMISLFVVLALAGCAHPPDTPAMAAARQQVSVILTRLLGANDDVCQASGGRCSFDLKIVPVARPDAAFGLGFIAVSLGLTQWTRSDDELSIPIAHEIAHMLLGHGAATGQKRRHQENDADRLGLYLAARAGYDITVAADLAARITNSFPPEERARIEAIGYPPLAERTANIRQIVREIEIKRAGQQSLVPVLAIR
jgi:Zn-dependent protease with chaperone function